MQGWIEREKQGYYKGQEEDRTYTTQEEQENRDEKQIQYVDIRNWKGNG